MSSEILSAIVLGSIDLGEADRLVHLLTRERGRITVRARGARKSRKRYGGRLDRFSLIRVHLRTTARGRASLGAVDLLEPFLGIRSDLVCTAMADLLVEMARTTVHEEEPSAELFGLVVRALTTLDGGTPPPEGWLIALSMEVLRLSGLAVALDHCCVCGAPPGGGFSLAAGGVVCEDHADGDVQRMTRPALERLQTLSRLELADPASAGRSRADRGLRVLMQRFCEYHLERRLRSSAFLDSLLDDTVDCAR